MKNKLILGWIAASLLAGCDYKVRLVDKPELPIDKALVGVWKESSQQERVERILVLPFSENEYLVVWSTGAENSLYARACLCKETDFVLVQFTLFGSDEGPVIKEEDEDAHLHQYYAYSVKDDKLTLSRLNTDVVDRDVATPAALLAAIQANRTHPKLFDEETVYTRVKPTEPQKDDAEVKRPPIPKAWQ